MPLLWPNQKPQLPDNRHVVDQRLKSLKSRLSKDNTLCKKYTDVMEKYRYIQRYEAELVEKESGFDSQVSWFLPHHPVLQAKKPSKVRIVFDCGAECDGKSPPSSYSGQMKGWIKILLSIVWQFIYLAHHLYRAARHFVCNRH